MSVSVDTEFDEMKMNKTISERIMHDRIIYYLETVILHVVFNVHVCANGSHGEHIESKIMHNVLKVWVSLQKKFSPLVYVPSVMC